MKHIYIYKFCIGNHLSDNFPSQNGVKQDVLPPLIFNFVSEYSIKEVQENQVGLELDEKNQLLAYSDYADLL
jgi:hypothetical protein